MIAEGARVAYVGDGVGSEAGLRIDDRGQVVQPGGPDACHVLWHTGARKGDIVLVRHLDLVAQVAPETDLLGNPLVRTAIRDAYDERGAAGVINSLNREGHLAAFAEIGEEVLATVATRVRDLPVMREVLAQLDRAEADDVVAVASAALLRDVFGAVR